MRDLLTEIEIILDIISPMHRSCRCDKAFGISNYNLDYGYLIARHF